MIMKKPLVSIIMPSFNCEKTIEYSIESVINQSYQQWQLIVVDDCSTDCSRDVIKRYTVKDSRIKLFVSSSNSGPAATRNRAIDVASGRFIAFLDADDSWEPQKLEKQISFMLEKDIAFSFTSYRKIDEDGKFLRNRIAPSSLTYQDLLSTNHIGCLTACYDSDKLGKVFMPDIARCQDFALWLKILKRLDKGYGLNECLASYRVGSSTVSSNKIITAHHVWHVYRQVEKLSFIQSCYYFLSYIIHGIKNRI